MGTWAATAFVDQVSGGAGSETGRKPPCPSLHHEKSLEKAVDVCVGPVGPARQPFVEQGAGSDRRREPPLALHRETTTPVSMAALIISTPAPRLPRTTSTRRTPWTLPKRPTRGREVF